MAPVYDTDIAEERWSRDEWREFELWEKIEVRLRRQKYLWIAATAVLFLILSAVPTVLQRTPKWTSLSATRELASQISRIKTEAGIESSAFRIRFAEGGSLSYVVEKTESCSAEQATVVRKGSLLPRSKRERYALLSEQAGAELGIPGLVTSFCYDPRAGSGAGERLVGFGVAPVKDLTEKRTDRLSVLLLEGSSAEISFE